MLGEFVNPYDMTLEQIYRLQGRFQPTLECIEKTIDFKIAKKSGYAKYKKYDLFLITDVWMTDMAQEKITEYIFDRCHGHFAYVYILSEGQDFFIFNVNEKKKSHIRYPEELQQLHDIWSVNMYDEICRSHVNE